ncbi:hypothetical protein J4229_03255 [Candidatus Pacearchaeota archaeon]|nr:hypothetical protein [Candidatus Pacearchaeota archaeon]
MKTKRGKHKKTNKYPLPILIILLVALIITLLFSLSYKTTNVIKGPHGNCVDSDKGINIIEKGKTSGGYVNEEDSCLSAISVKEGYCLNNKVYWKTENCPEKKVCKDGICIDSSQVSQEELSDEIHICTDTDTKKEFYTKGKVTTCNYNSVAGECELKIDSCINNDKLKEFFCISNSEQHNFSSESSTNYDCTSEGKVCNDGACIISGQAINDSTGNKNYTCLDIDGGLNYNVKGTLTERSTDEENQQRTDRCIIEGTIIKLQEFYCNENRIAYIYDDCPLNQTCISGACQ